MFSFEPYRSPFTNSIADLMLRRGDIAARSAERIAAIQGHAAEERGQGWAHALMGTGQAVSGAIQQATDPRRQLEQIQLQDAKQNQQGRAAVDTMLRGDQLAPGDAGPRQESYLTPEGLFDIPKMNQALSGRGLAHLAPDLLKGAEGINDSILKHQQLAQQAAAQHTLLLGDLADGALKLTKAGTPLVQAMDFVVQPALATKRISPQDYAQVKAQIQALPPEQQTQALTTFMDAAAKLGGGKTLGKDAQELDRYGRVVASNMVPEKPTKASLAADLSSPDPAVRARAKTAIEALTPSAKRTDSELALDAYAKSLGKTQAEELTDAERQAYDTRKATISSNQAFTQHQRERQYDIAHPIPEKAANQDKLEQEYRTVLARGLSSRSGGLGLEDAKVQQANHLLALMDQNYDPKSGAYNIPRAQYEELALGMAKLLSGTGAVGEGMKNDLVQATAAGDLKKVATYLTGTPFNGSTQDVFKMLRDSIERQGSVALENREGEMRYLRGLAPTDLEEPRRQKLEATSLNPLRQSKVFTNAQGERKLLTSLDGGKTWR